MIVRYRYRVYPGPHQEMMLARTFGCARVVFNDALRARDAAYAAGEKISDTEVQRRVITLAKATPEREWLGEVASVALVQACQDARRAYRNWFDSLSGKRKGRKVGHPRFRSRKGRRQSFRLTRNGFALHGDRLYVAKVGDMKVKWSRSLPSVPSSVTVTREADGRYYASFVVEVAAAPLPPVTADIGIDLGLSVLAATSDGELIANPGTCAAVRGSSPAHSGTCPASRRAAGTGRRRGSAWPCSTARPARRGPTTCTRRLCGWSATTKRSTSKTSPCPGSPARGWRSQCTTPDGRRSSGCWKRKPNATGGPW